MTGNEMFLLKRGCVALGLDEIAKDIKEKEDNAMAMEFTKCIGELLKNNGVVPKIKQYGCDFYGENSFQSKFGVIIDELDFTEHDKVFEDEMKILKTQIEHYKNSLYSNVKKIDELKCKNKELKQITKGYEDKIAELENIINHKLGGWDKHRITYQEILGMKAENDLLKQRIAELESEKTEKPTKINLNDRIKVKLTPLGAEIYYHQYDEVNKRIRENGGTELEPIMPQIDKDGYTEFQLWHFMELYGGYIGMCKPNVINPFDIVIVE